MAITWELVASNVDVSTGRANITATRTDSESALEPQVYSYLSTPIHTTQARVLLMDTIKADVEARALYDISIEALISDLEQIGEQALEAWELTR